ncbi:DUF945 family protein [Undibacterium sp. TJN25]|uniref:DUF945 family protein n=1 Tax=Undibacterium sp. TJN25 TaxID=3413056 RepID=UPI003BF1A236
MQAQKLSPAARIDSYNRFDFSPSTRQQLLKIFGKEKPWKLQATRRADGKVDVSLALDSLDYSDPVLGAKIRLAPETGLATFDNTFRQAEVNFGMPWMKLEHQDGWILAMDRLSGQATQHLGNHDLWLGKANFLIESIDVTDASAENITSIRGIEWTSEISQHGKMVDISYAVSSQSAKFGGTELGALRFVFKMNNLNEQALSATKKGIDRQVTSTEPEEKQNAAILALLKKNGIKMLTPTTSLDIDEISVVYHDLKAVVRGKVWLNQAKQSDLLSFDKWKDKLALHFDMEMPMGFAEDVARFFSRRSLQQKLEPGQTVTEDAVNQSANLMVTQMVENLRAQKMIRVDNGVLRSSLDYSAGKFKVNGNPVNFNLPKLNAGGAKAGG